jgi:phosphopentomutase
MKTILLVIDGLGIGEMTDVAQKRKQDVGANTYLSIKNNLRHDDPSLKSISLFESFFNPETFCSSQYFDQTLDKYIVTGQSKLNYNGADSFLGHTEISGNKVTFAPTYTQDIYQKILDQFPKYNIKLLPSTIININDNIFISNNVESDPGNNINVIGNLSQVSFEDLINIGNFIRDNFEPARVIVEGNTDLPLEKYLTGLITIQNDNNQNIQGVANGKVPNFYEHNFQSVHIGLKINGEKNIISRFLQQNLPVALIGKTADLFQNSYALNISLIDTKQTLETIIEHTKKQQNGFIFANVREIDLSGHSQNVEKGTSILAIINNYLPELIGELKPEDTLIITADHGNDPLIKHSQHTRENVPLIMVSTSPTLLPKKIGVRDSLSDISATIAKLHNLMPVETGVSMI